MDRTPKQVPPSTPPELTVPPTPKHTPEPWKIERGFDIHNEGQPREVFFISSPHREYSFAVVYATVDRKEQEANAALIALSPRMARVLCDMSHGVRASQLIPVVEENYVLLKALDEAAEIFAELKKVGAL